MDPLGVYASWRDVQHLKKRAATELSADAWISLWSTVDTKESEAQVSDLGQPHICASANKLVGEKQQGQQAR